MKKVAPIPAWLSPDIHPATTLVCQQILNDKSPEVVAEGPTRTSKTLLDLQKLFHNLFTIPNFRGAIVRANSVDLDASIRYDITRTLLRYPIGHPRSPIRAEGGPTRFHTLHFPRGGECRLGGLNNPTHILGTEYDMMLISQLDEINEEQYQICKTRCAGSAGNWLDADGMPLFQILSDMNPTVPDAWMYEREKEDLIKFYFVNFKDNPYFYRRGRWSKIGYTTVSELNRGLTGIYHDRYFKGLRVAAEGAVFEILDCHLIDTLPDLTEYTIYNAMDFGMSDPSVCLWIAWNKLINDTIVFREWRRTNTDILTMGSIVNLINEVNYHTIEETVVDNDLNNIALLQRDCDIPCVSASTVKGPGSIMRGVHLLQHALAQTVLGRPGGIRFYTGLLHDEDPNPEAKGYKNTIQELRNARYDPNKSDAIIDGADHGIDPLRYHLLRRHQGMLDPNRDGVPLTVGNLNV